MSGASIIIISSWCIGVISLISHAVFKGRASKKKTDENNKNQQVH